MNQSDEIKNSGLKATPAAHSCAGGVPAQYATPSDRGRRFQGTAGRRRRHRIGHRVPRADAVRASRPAFKRTHFETGKAVFELNEGRHHDHLVCLNCGKVEEFYDEAIELRQQAIARERGFELQEHALSLYAVCVKADCPHREKRGR
jgi:Fur family ferric uptake transcriptional regulator